MESPQNSTFNNKQPTEVIVIESNNPINEEEDLFVGKKRKKTSEVWKHFEVVTLPSGELKAACKYCKAKLVYSKGGPTTTFLRLSKYRRPYRKNIDTKKEVLGIEPGEETMSCITNFKYDHAKVRKVAVYMIIAHEYPFAMMEHEFFNHFMWTVSPFYKQISRTMLRNDVMSVYAMERKKLKEGFQGVSKVSITSDFWKSSQQIGYMRVTAHFIDSNNEFKLHKRVISFCDVPPPHSGLVISDAIMNCLMNWGIKNKLYTVTFDNASNNDSEIKNLKENFGLKSSISYAGKLFHVRCCAHIINLLVQDGLSEVKDTIENIRKSVKYINASEARLLKFSEMAKQLRLAHKKLILDVPTGWNSTHAMLEEALQFKSIFLCYEKKDPLYIWLPSESEWLRAEEVCQFLDVFKVATDSISGRDYLTSNMLLPVVWKIK